MPKARRNLRVAALGSLVLGVGAVPLLAQETNTVGPAQLKDFQLPGQRTTPPVQVQPQPQPQPPVATPVEPRPEPPRAAAPAASTARPERPAPRAPVADDAGPAPAPVIDGPLTATPFPEAGPPEVPAAQAAPSPTLETPPSSASWNPLWLAAPAAAVLLALVWLWRRRRRDAEEQPSLATALAAEAPEPRPAPEPVPASPARAAAGPRARLEVEFKPERAAATDTEAIVHYDIIVRNLGADAARNIRIDARMLNAGDQAAIGAFLRGPIHEHSGSPHITLAPGADMKLASAIAMPKDEVRAIVVQGRSIFVPVVAINVAYDWGPRDNAGTGRTSRSWVVGREPETPSARMGAFRLDLGPRIYRSVGQRPTELANVA